MSSPTPPAQSTKEDDPQWLALKSRLDQLIRDNDLGLYLDEIDLALAKKALDYVQDNNDRQSAFLDKAYAISGVERGEQERTLPNLPEELDSIDDEDARDFAIDAIEIACYIEEEKAKLMAIMKSQGRDFKGVVESETNETDA